MLVFTSKPLLQGLEVTGNISVTLQVSSSAKDTDFTVKLIDVYPDGNAFNIQEGVTQMRYHKSLKQAELITLNKRYQINVDLNATSNFFAKGHRIRIEVSSSNFPRIERYLNTGEPNHIGESSTTAENTVWYGGESQSYITLPVIPRYKSD